MNKWGQWTTRIILVALVLRLLCVWLGLDADTTVNTLSSSLSLASTSVIVLMVALCMGYGYFGPHQTGPILGFEGLRKERPLQSGIFLVCASAAFAAWLWSGSLGMAAQRLEGTPKVVVGRVVLVLNAPYRDSCRERVEVLELDQRAHWSVCVRQIFGRPLLTWAPADGALVRMRLKHTMLGDVVISMEREAE
jgi:hypothetical protein